METDFEQLAYFPIELRTEVWRRLTPRQRQVVELTAQGFEVPKIATILSIKPGTIRRHRANAVTTIERYAPSGGGEGGALAKLARTYAAQLVDGSTDGIHVPPHDWQPQHHTRRGLSGRRP